MIYDLVNNEILHQKLERFNFSNPPINPSELAINLTETMLSNKGFGLAANQCGLPYRVFVVSNNPVITFFNPLIVDYSKETALLEEGCLSYPGYVIKIKRPKSIKIRFALPNGDVQTKIFSGLTARIVQHEYDHVEGINFKDRASFFHKEKANKDHKIWLRRNK